MSEDTQIEAIRAEYKRLMSAAEQAKDLQKRHNLKVAAKAQAYRMKLLLYEKGGKVTIDELFNKYLK
jgi:hypothetical protein